MLDLDHYQTALTPILIHVEDLVGDARTAVRRAQDSVLCQAYRSAACRYQEAADLYSVMSARAHRVHRRQSIAWQSLAMEYETNSRECWTLADAQKGAGADTPAPHHYPTNCL